MSSKPPAPEPIPQYIVDALHRQDKQSLAAIEDYAAVLREHIEAQESEPLDEDDLADENEELVDVEDSDGGTVVIKKVPCGKDCSGCPHGPYKYTVQRVEGKLEWEYKGPVNQ
jgi:hypothetical protein